MDALEENVDAVIDVDLALFDSVRAGLRLIVVLAVRDVPERVQTMHVMIYIEDGGICIVAQAPCRILKFGYGRGIDVHLDQVRPSHGINSCQLPFIPYSVGCWVRLLASNRHGALVIVERTVYLLGSGCEIETIYDGTVSGCTAVIGIANEVVVVEPGAE